MVRPSLSKHRGVGVLRRGQCGLTRADDCQTPRLSAGVRGRCHAVGHSPLRLLSRAGTGLGIVQNGEFLKVIRDHDLSEATCDGDHVRPGGCPEILLVGIAGRLVSSGVERDAQLTYESDLFLCPQTDAEVSLGLVRVAEVIPERVEDVVQVLEHRGVEPDWPEPRRRVRREPGSSLCGGRLHSRGRA